MPRIRHFFSGAAPHPRSERLERGGGGAEAGLAALRSELGATHAAVLRGTCGLGGACEAHATELDSRLDTVAEGQEFFVTAVAHWDTWLSHADTVTRHTDDQGEFAAHMGACVCPERVDWWCPGRATAHPAGGWWLTRAYPGGQVERARGGGRRSDSFGANRTVRQRMALERRTTPKLSRRTGSNRVGGRVSC